MEREAMPPGVGMPDEVRREGAADAGEPESAVGPIGASRSM